MKYYRKKGFILVEVIVGFALIGLLASVVFPSITATKIGMVRVEKKAILIDQVQRITKGLKAPSDDNNNLLNKLASGAQIDYRDEILPDDLEASVYIDKVCEDYQVYTVEVKVLGEDTCARLQATRNFK